MRVLLVVGQVAGGAGRHVHELAGGLVERGWQVRVACPAEVAQRYDFDAVGAQVTPVEIGERPSPRTDARSVRTLRALAAEADVVHAHGLRAGALACLAAARHRPVAVTLHNAAPEDGRARRIFQLLSLVVARAATIVLAVSPDLEAAMWRLGARDARPAVVAAAPARPPARAAADVRRELGDPRLLALTIGRLAPQKDLDLLLDAVARLAPGFGLTVAVAGDGPLLDSLARRVATEALPVRLLGAREDVPDLLAAADLVVSSARWEGQPVWLQEAVRAGLPVVATDVGGTRGVVGDAGVLVPHGDPQALADATTRVCEDPELRDSLAAQAHSRAATLPGRDDALDAAERIYTDLRRAAPSGRRPR